SRHCSCRAEVPPAGALHTSPAGNGVSQGEWRERGQLDKLHALSPGGEHAASQCAVLELGGAESACRRRRLARGDQSARGGAARCPCALYAGNRRIRSEEHTSELQSREKLVCRLLLEKKQQSG